MSVEFVTGRPGAQASRYVSSKIGDVLQEDPLASIQVITPRQSSFEIAGEIMRANGLDGVLTVSVGSAQKLVERILDETYGGAVDPVDTAGKSMAIRRILDDNKDTMRAFSGLGSGQQLPSLIAKQVSDLHVMDITHEELAEYAQAVGNRRLADLAVIYEALPHALHTDTGERMDAEERMDLAIQHIGEADFVRESKLAVFYGFSSFSAQMIRLVEAVMKTVPETIIYLPGAPEKSPDRHVYYAAQETMRRLTPAAMPHGLRVTRLDDEKAAQSPDDILHASRGLFAHSRPKKMKSAPSMKVGAAKDAEQEIRATAAEIVRLHRDEGIPFSRMAILWGDTAGGTYEGLVRRVFGEAHVPYFTDEQKTLAQSNLAEFILTAAEMTSGRLKKDSVLAHVATGFTRLTAEQQSALQNYAASRVSRGPQFLTPFNRDDPRDFRDDFDTAESARSAVIDPVVHYLRDALRDGREKDAGKVFGALLEYLSAVLSSDAIEEKAANLGARYEQASFLEQSYKGALAIVRQAKDMLAGTKLGAGEARRILQAGFEAVRLSVVPAGVDEVQAGPLGGFYVPEVDALFVVGVNDEVLPKFMEMPHDILTPREWTDMVREVKGVELPSASDEQKYLIVEAVRQARKYIQWTYSTENALKPSVMIQYLDELFEEPLERVDLEKQAMFLKQNAYDFTVRQIRSRADGIPVRMDRNVRMGVLGDPSFEKRTSTLRASLSKVNSAVHAAPLRPPHRLSASRISTFYKCPYKHFVQYQLGAWVPEEPEITNTASGRYMHGVLNRLARGIREGSPGPASWADVPEEQFAGFVNSAIETEAIEQLGTTIYPRTKAILDVLKPEIARAAEMLRKQYARGGLLSAASEAAFEVFSGSLTGIIDRVDSALVDGQRYYSIVDYKSSDMDFSLEDVLSGTDLQLTVYLLALEELIREGALPPGRLAGAGFLNTMHGNEDPATKWWKEYRMKGMLAVPSNVALSLYGLEQDSPGLGLFSTMMRITKDGNYYSSDERRVYLPGEGGAGDLEALLNCTKDRIAKGREQISNGVNDIYPYRSSRRNACTFCEFRSICGFDERQPGMQVRKLPEYDGGSRAALREEFGSDGTGEVGAK